MTLISSFLKMVFNIDLCLALPSKVVGERGAVVGKEEGVVGERRHGDTHLQFQET